jgi:GPI-anchor transamidase subunit K
MLPENHACSPRNPFPGTVLFKEESNENYYCDDVEVDYKADDLTYQSILNMFRGRYAPDVSFYSFLIHLVPGKQKAPYR